MDDLAGMFAPDGVWSDYNSGQRDTPQVGQLGNMPKGPKQYADYIRMMQAMTRPPREAGPEARRAEGGMPAGPRNYADDQLGADPMQHGGNPLLSLLAMFGSGK